MVNKIQKNGRSSRTTAKQVCATNVSRETWFKPSFFSNKILMVDVYLRGRFVRVKITYEKFKSHMEAWVYCTSSTPVRRQERAISAQELRKYKKDSTK